MEPSILLALVGVGGSVLGALVGSWSSHRLQRDERLRLVVGAATSRQALQNAERAVLTAGSMPSSRIFSALRVSQHEVEWQFDSSGKGLKLLRYLGLHALQNIQDLRLPVYEDGSGSIGYPEVASTAGSRWSVSIDDKNAAVRGGHLNADIIIAGLMTPDSEGASFVMRLPFERQFALTFGEAEQKYTSDSFKHEYARTGIHCPVGELSQTVHFPWPVSRLGVRPYAVAFFAYSETLHESESARLNREAGALVLSETAATLHVSAPALGLSYGIAWMPPLT